MIAELLQPDITTAVVIGYFVVSIVMYVWLLRRYHVQASPGDAAEPSLLVVLSWVWPLVLVWLAVRWIDSGRNPLRRKRSPAAPAPADAPTREHQTRLEKGMRAAWARYLRCISDGYTSLAADARRAHDELKRERDQLLARGRPAPASASPALTPAPAPKMPGVVEHAHVFAGALPGAPFRSFVDMGALAAAVGPTWPHAVMCAAAAHKTATTSANAAQPAQPAPYSLDTVKLLARIAVLEAEVRRLKGEDGEAAGAPAGRA